MSGGSLDYASHKLDDIAQAVHLLGHRHNKPEWRAVGTQLLLLSKALHDIGWVASGDYSEGAERKAIEAALNPGFETKIMAELLKDAEKARDAINDVIMRGTIWSVGP